MTLDELGDLILELDAELGEDWQRTTKEDLELLEALESYRRRRYEEERMSLPIWCCLEL